MPVSHPWKAILVKADGHRLDACGAHDERQVEGLEGFHRAENQRDHQQRRDQRQR